jgi:hypothetical protein
LWLWYKHTATQMVINPTHFQTKPIHHLNDLLSHSWFFFLLLWFWHGIWDTSDCTTYTSPIQCLRSFFIRHCWWATVKSYTLCTVWATLFHPCIISLHAVHMGPWLINQIFFPSNRSHGYEWHGWCLLWAWRGDLNDVLCMHRLHYAKWSLFVIHTFCICAHELCGWVMSRGKYEYRRIYIKREKYVT